MNSPQYEAAYADHQAAFVLFDRARRDYLAGRILEADYFAAKALYDAVVERFEAAWQCEQDG